LTGLFARGPGDVDVLEFFLDNDPFISNEFVFDFELFHYFGDIELGLGLLVSVSL